jgi:cephalosporin hydroxylase
VAEELRVWADLVSPGCYLVVEDTALGTQYLPGWGGSLEAAERWLPAHPDFEVDRSREKFLVTLHPGGWLRRRA